MDDEGWEARMAERARARRGPEPPEKPWTLHLEEKAKDLANLRATMTLAEAMQRLAMEPVGCGCCGPPNCCINVWAVAEELHRAASIVAALLAARS